MKIERGRWYTCTKDTLVGVASVRWWKNHTYYAVDDNLLMSVSAYKVNEEQAKNFREAKHDEIPTDIKLMKHIACWRQSVC